MEMKLLYKISLLVVYFCTFFYPTIHQNLQRRFRVAGRSSVQIHVTNTSRMQGQQAWRNVPRNPP